MEQLTLVLAPALVALLTEGAKRLAKLELKEDNKAVLRTTVLVLSFAVAVGNSVLNGEPLDAGNLQLLSDTLINALSATGLWLLARK